MLSAEEKLKGMHRRVGCILTHLGLSFRDVPHLHDPDDVTLATVDRNGLVAPSLSLLRLEKTVEKIRPAFVLVENAAEVHPANEIARPPVASCSSSASSPSRATPPWA
jgi:hypothetical protein